MSSLPVATYSIQTDPYMANALIPIQNRLTEQDTNLATLQKIQQANKDAQEQAQMRQGYAQKMTGRPVGNALMEQAGAQQQQMEQDNLERTRYQEQAKYAVDVMTGLVKNNNSDSFKTMRDNFENSDNPFLQSLYETIKGVDVVGPDLVKYEKTIHSEVEAEEWLKQNPSARAFYPSAKDVPLGRMEVTADISNMKNPKIKSTEPKDEKVPSKAGENHRDAITLENQSPEQLKAFFEKNKANMSPAAGQSLLSIIDAQGRKKKLDRNTNVIAKVDPEGKIMGFEVRQEPAPIKLTVNNGTAPAGVVGKFSDDQFERYYTSGQAKEFLPQVIQNYRNVQGKADWDAGFQDWLKRNGKTGAQAAVEARETRGENKSLDMIIKQENAIGSFEKGARNAMTIADTLQKKMDRGQFPGINKISQLIKYQAGNPNVKPLINSVTTAMTEYMKVVTAGTAVSSAELSVGAQERAKKILENSDNYETFKNQMDVFEQEMTGKLKGIRNQREELTTSIGGRNGLTKEKAPVAPKGVQYRTKDGTVRTSDGKGGWN